MKVEWSDEDQCYLGACPNVIGHCCHGDDPDEVLRETYEISRECSAIRAMDEFMKDGAPIYKVVLPPDISRDDMQKMLEGMATLSAEATPLTHDAFRSATSFTLERLPEETISVLRPFQSTNKSHRSPRTSRVPFNDSATN